MVSQRFLYPFLIQCVYVRVWQTLARGRQGVRRSTPYRSAQPEGKFTCVCLPGEVLGGARCVYSMCGTRRGRCFGCVLAMCCWDASDSTQRLTSLRVHDRALLILHCRKSTAPRCWIFLSTQSFACCTMWLFWCISVCSCFLL